MALFVSSLNRFAEVCLVARDDSNAMGAQLEVTQLNAIIGSSPDTAKEIGTSANRRRPYVRRCPHSGKMDYG